LLIVSIEQGVTSQSSDGTHSAAASSRDASRRSRQVSDRRFSQSVGLKMSDNRFLRSSSWALQSVNRADAPAVNA